MSFYFIGFHFILPFDSPFIHRLCDPAADGCTTHAVRINQRPNQHVFIRII